ncbi:hypothetical protein HMPREF0860_1309 [Treponema socranskii subsp. socranskii VPI DR56BR1116 = ATCC 35536]|uniref:Uncharacterized protein n=1 Tax=Treponema socranskii subsp. socranskii VPI DR56BR1116 = ATCC 35536 TaxID=1125725 RepID=U2MSS6_TRESO|nr:hypothetical protein HMPREF1325_1931 [Treponema socranskii subsp. socranskii VPI DR56BR1116 = ATCC 35536]ERK04710.1 hypothetical protein HMPREF0860_1309 [Treponema socranskii subsp. socranskii VPI DR56BR1116 = ATCC 35536]
MQVAHCSELLCKSGGEKRPSRFSFIGDAHNSCALLGIIRSCINYPLPL